MQIYESFKISPPKFELKNYIIFQFKPYLNNKGEIKILNIRKSKKSYR